MAEIEYISRSVHDARDWKCECGTLNKCKLKLVFSIPQFECSNPDCHKKYLNQFPYDFCLADVTVNRKHLLQRVLDQGDKDECMAFAIVQVLHIMHNVDVLLKKDELDPRKVNLDPAKVYMPYYKKYPEKAYGQTGARPRGMHKFIRMALEIKKHGIPLKSGDSDNDYYRIGDISTICKDDFEQICEHLADGIPMLATFFPGVSFQGLEYCKMYFPPDYKDVMECNAKNPDPPHKKHAAHMVVIIGIVSRPGGLRGFFFINSYGELWCPREVLEELRSETSELVGVGVPERKALKGGIGKVHDRGLYWNVIKFSRYAETAAERQLVDEPEEGHGQYQTNPINSDLILH